MAACGARAAAGDAGDRVLAVSASAWRAASGRIPPAWANQALSRAERRHRISLGGRPFRSTADLAADLVAAKSPSSSRGGTVGAARQWRRPKPFRSFSRRSRSRSPRVRRQPQPAGRQRHRGNSRSAASSRQRGSNCCVSSLPQPRVSPCWSTRTILRLKQDNEGVQEAARRLGKDIIVVKAGTANEIEGPSQRRPAGGRRSPCRPVIRSSSAPAYRSALALRHSMPAIYDRQIVAAGGLMSYGTSIVDTFRQAGTYVGRILKGEKPADLPVCNRPSSSWSSTSRRRRRLASRCRRRCSPAPTR